MHFKTSSSSSTLIVVLLFLFHLISSVSLQELLESHQAVLSILKSDNYSNNLIPTDSSSPLRVSVNLGLRDIEDLNDRSMELRAQLSLRQIWIDPRLQYTSNNPHSFVTLNSDIAHAPWTPDIFVQHEKGTLIHSITRPNSFVRIYPNGTLYFSTRLSLTVSCFMNLRRFPFDRQICNIRLSSYAYTVKTMEIHWDKEGLEQVTDISSGHLTQFRMVGHTTGRCIMRSSGGEFSAVYVRLAFRRQLAYYNVQLFIPCSMLIVITWVAFWLGNAMEARLSLTVTVLLTLSTQIAGTTQSLAQVSYTTGFTFFTGVCLTFATMSILQSATVFFIQGEGLTVLRRDSKLKKVKTQAVELEKGCDMGKWNAAGSIMDTRAQNLDKCARLGFPITFLLFLVGYFSFYLWDYRKLDEEFINRGQKREINWNQTCVGGWTTDE